MTAIFKNIHTGELVSHNQIIHIQEESLFGCNGFGLHFNDNTYCLMNTETFQLISVAQE